MNIGRTLFWFKDGDKQLHDLNNRFFEQGILLNRLLNEVYDGKKIKFININFSTNETYLLFPVLPKNKPYYYAGNLQYYGEFNRRLFENLSFKEQQNFIWKKANDYLKESAIILKNDNLAKSVEFAFNEGLKRNLNPDFKVIEANVNVGGKELKASVWINFNKDEMSSKFTLEDAGKILFEKHIDKTKVGIEFFLEIYKSIETDNNNIIIKGPKDVEYLPLKIPFSEILINKNVI